MENYDERNQYEIAVDATYSKDRAEKFYFVGPLYSASTALFYSNLQHPNGPISPRTGSVVNTINDMQDFKVCGKLGWNYEIYYTKYGFPETVVIDDSSIRIESILKKISHSRCELFEAQTSLVIGAILTDDTNVPDDISCLKLDIPPVEFHLMVSKTSPRAEELVARLSAALTTLKSTRQLQATMDASLNNMLAKVKSSLSKCM